MQSWDRLVIVRVNAGSLLADRFQAEYEVSPSYDESPEGSFLVCILTLETSSLYLGPNDNLMREIRINI